MKKYLFIAVILYINIILFGYITDQIRKQSVEAARLKYAQQMKEIKQFGKIITE